MKSLRSYEAAQVRAFTYALCKLDIVNGNQIYRFGSSLIYLFSRGSRG